MKNKSSVQSDLGLRKGLRIGNYEIISALGQGGMGVVCKAKDHAINRIVAIKFILKSIPNSISMKRFEQEAQIYAALSHPNIVKLYALGNYNKSPYMVMEYIEGMELQDYVKKKEITLEEKVLILKKIGDALVYTHENKIIHRDIKPFNIMVRENGEPVVMDFGIARLNSQNKALSKTGQVMGSPSYMAPEQVLGQRKKICERTDVYALGGLLYFLITGKTAVEQRPVMKMMYDIMNVPPIPPCTFNPNIPKKLEEICMTALEKEIENRYSSRAFVNELEKYLQGQRCVESTYHKKRKKGI